MVGHTVPIAGHVCNIDTDMFQHYSGSSASRGHVLYTVEVLNLGFSLYMYSFDSLENMACVRYHIVYDFVAVCFSDSSNSETDIDYIEVFVLCLVVQIL